MATSRIGQQLDDTLGEQIGSVGWSIEGGITGHLAQHIDVATDQRCVREHGLYRRQAKTLVERRQDHESRLSVERCQLALGHISEVLEPPLALCQSDLALDLSRLPPEAAGEHQRRRLGESLADETPGVQQPDDVLAWLQRAYMEAKEAGHSLGKLCGLDVCDLPRSQVDRPDPPGSRVSVGYELVTYGPAVGDQPCCFEAGVVQLCSQLAQCLASHRPWDLSQPQIVDRHHAGATGQIETPRQKEVGGEQDIVAISGNEQRLGPAENPRHQAGREHQVAGDRER